MEDSKKEKPEKLFDDEEDLDDIKITTEVKLGFVRAEDMVVRDPELYKAILQAQEDVDRYYGKPYDVENEVSEVSALGFSPESYPSPLNKTSPATPQITPSSILRHDSVVKSKKNMQRLNSSRVLFDEERESQATLLDVALLPGVVMREDGNQDLQKPNSSPSKISGVAIDRRKTVRFLDQ